MAVEAHSPVFKWAKISNRHVSKEDTQVTGQPVSRSSLGNHRSKPHGEAASPHEDAAGKEQRAAARTGPSCILPSGQNLVEGP